VQKYKMLALTIQKQRNNLPSLISSLKCVYISLNCIEKGKSAFLISSSAECPIQYFSYFLFQKLPYDGILPQ